jgi:hypothetical protein
LDPEHPARCDVWLESDVDPVIPLASESEDVAFGMLEQYLVDSHAGKRPWFTAYIVYPRAFHGDRLIRSFNNAGLHMAARARGNRFSPGP